MDINQKILNKLRDLALKDHSVEDMVIFLKSNITDNKNNRLIIMWHFMKAFNLSLTEVRPLEGATCLGNAAYDEEEINKLLLPLIKERVSQM